MQYAEQLAVVQRSLRRGGVPRLGAAATIVAVTVAAAITGVTLQLASTSARADASSVPDTATHPTDSLSVAALPPSVPTGVHIPAIKLDTSALVPLHETPTGTMEVPADATTVGWFATSSTPGSAGAAVLAAHSRLGPKRGAFHDLPLLRAGDTIVVRRADGTAARFTVYTIERADGIAGAITLASAPTDAAELRLITWAGENVAEPASGRAVVVFARLDYTWQ